MQTRQCLDQVASTIKKNPLCFRGSNRLAMSVMLNQAVKETNVQQWIEGDGPGCERLKDNASY